MVDIAGIGALLQNRYRLDAEIGRGGVGVIYRGHDTLLGRDVAVKVLSSATLDAQGQSRLLREARAAAQLNHPNIVTVYDAGRSESGDPSAPTVPFIVMELVEGQSLFEHQPQSLEETLSIAQQICVALEHAHAHGIVHRDLKLENVLTTPDGTAKLMDFGLAHSISSRVTTEGAIVGTVFYLAPEQALGKAIDARVDLYALGVMLYELTAGRLPFSGDDMLSVVAQHLHAPVVPPSTHNPAIPQALDMLIVRLLEKRPEDRPNSAAEVHQALGALLTTAQDDIKAQEEKGATLRSASEIRQRHNLPAQTTPFIGRERQLREVRELVERPDIRLLTLSGPGGTGKTRLALQVAASFLGDFGDGVFFVPLAQVRDPELVLPAVAQILGIRHHEGGLDLGLETSLRLSPDAVLETLRSYLREKQMLLVIDNFEQVISAAPSLAELLTTAPQLKVMVTSRALLRIYGEHDYQVPPLSVPDPQRLPPLEHLTQIESMQLFVQRAQAAKSDFVLDEENAPDVAEICARLDGLPLAIELAAARVRLLSPRRMLSQLDNRFRLLQGGARNLPARHQTLRSAIDWSYDLLGEPEKLLFRRLAVFMGGCTIEAVGAVCDIAGDMDVLGGLESLLDQSLLRVTDISGEIRFEMLETIHEYAWERLRAVGEADRLVRRHAEFFAQFAVKAEQKLPGLEQVKWLNRMEAERKNLRAALKWILGQPAPTLDLIEKFLGALDLFWTVRGYHLEGHRWFVKIADRQPAMSPSVRAKVLWRVGLWLEDRSAGRALIQEGLNLCEQLGDKSFYAWSLLAMGYVAKSYDPSAEFLEQSLARFREVDNKLGIEASLYSLGGVAWRQHKLARAEAFLSECLDLAKESGALWRIGHTLRMLGNVALELGETKRVADFYGESLEYAKKLGDKFGVAECFNSLGELARLEGEYEKAESYYEESLRMREGIGAPQGIALIQHNLAYVALHKGDPQKAKAYFEKSLLTFQEFDERDHVAFCLAGLACVAVALEQPEHAARLFGASEALLETVGAAPRLQAADKAEYDRTVTVVRAQLEAEVDAAAFESAWAEGRTMVRTCSFEALTAELLACLPS